MLSTVALKDRGLPSQAEASRDIVEVLTASVGGRQGDGLRLGLRKIDLTPCRGSAGR